MEYDDTFTIATPEGVEITLLLAGAASRFVSALVDLSIQAGVLILLAIVIAIFGSGTGSSGVTVAIWFVLSFVVIVGYDIFFEVLNSGRTPGKRLNGLRVVRVEGHPVGFVTSAIRNTIRVVDFLPGSYLLGATVILATKKNQRIGDIVAGTLVVRERQARIPDLPANNLWIEQPVEADDRPAWDTSQVTGEEIAGIRQFLERRYSLEQGTRAQLARALADRLRPKVSGVGTDISNERFLETLVALKGRLER